MKRMSRYVKYGITLLICPVFFITNASLMKDATASTARADSSFREDVSPPEGYTEICRSQELILMADRQTGTFYIENERTEAVWYSVPEDTEKDIYSRAGVKNLMRSQVVIRYIQTADLVKSAHEVEAYSATESTIKTQVLEDGLRVQYDFEMIGISFFAEYRLQNGFFSASINTSAIRETGENIVSSCLLLPSFGAGNRSADGYLFVPDGSGALIAYNNENSGLYEKHIYGSERAVEYENGKAPANDSIQLPVFGLASGGAGLLGIVEGGAANASIAAWSGSEICGYNTVCPRFTLRSNYIKTMLYEKQQINRLSPPDESALSYTIRYYFLTGENSNYSGMARTYQKYLQEEKGMSSRSESPVLNVNLYGSIDVKANFIGFSYSKQQAVTTFTQAENIIDSFLQKGVDDLAIKLTGWGQSGISNGKRLTGAKISRAMGGSKRFNSLAKTAKSKNIPLTLETDFLTYRKGSDRYAAKTVYNETAVQYNFNRSVYKFETPYMLLSPGKIQEMSEEYLKSFRATGAENISLDVLTNTLYSNLNAASFFSKTEMSRTASNVLEQYRSSGLKVSGKRANDYAAVHLSKIYESPTRSSGESVFYREIPFYQMVFHGFVPMTAEEQNSSPDPTRNFLKAAESGLELLYNGMANDASIISDTSYTALYSTTVNIWQDDAINLHAQLKPLLERINSQKIISHDEPMPDITKTVYENMVTVYVNFTDEDANVDGITVNAKDFIVK